MPGSPPQLPAMRYGASPLATSVPRPEPHMPRAQATIFLSAWNRVIFGPGTSPTSSPPRMAQRTYRCGVNEVEQLPVRLPLTTETDTFTL